MRWQAYHSPPSVPAAGHDLAAVLHTGPFHAALRAAIRERGLPLERLRWHLARRGIPVAVSSLSGWQHGHAVPTRPGSVQAVQALEEILRLPPSSLVTLLTKARSGDGPGGGGGTTGSTGALDELLDALPGSRRDDLDVLSLQEKVVMDAGGHICAMWSRTLVRARTDGVDRYVVRYFGELDGAIERVRLVPVENCRLGRVRRHPHAPVLVAELLFGEVLRAGDTWVFERRIIDGTGSACTAVAHGVTRPVAQYLVEVRFDPAALPVDCHIFVRPGLYDDLHRAADLALNRQHAVHHVACDLTTGVLGIGWSWPDPPARTDPATHRPDRVDPATHPRRIDVGGRGDPAGHPPDGVAGAEPGGVSSVTTSRSMRR